MHPISVLGGYIPGEGRMSSTEIWKRRDGWREGLKMEPGRDGHCSLVLGKEGFIVTGGWMTENMVQLYNITSKTWKNLTQIPSEAERAYHGCARLNKTHIIIAGGKGTFDNGHLRSSWIFDIKKGIWSQAGDMNQKRDETALINIGGAVVAVGGYDENDYWINIEKFNPTTNSWNVLETKMKAKRQTHALANVPHMWFDYFYGGCQL